MASTASASTVAPADLLIGLRERVQLEIEHQRDRVYEELERGGAIRVYTNDSQHFVGVLTRDQRLLDAAGIAQLIENGHIPPLDELVAMDDRGELP